MQPVAAYCHTSGAEKLLQLCKRLGRRLLDDMVAGGHTAPGDLHGALAPDRERISPAVSTLAPEVKGWASDLRVLIGFVVVEIDGRGSAIILRVGVERDRIVEAPEIVRVDFRQQLVRHQTADRPLEIEIEAVAN